MMVKTVSLKSHIYVIVSVIIWGISQIALDDLYKYHTPESIVFYKLFFTGTIILIINYRRIKKNFSFWYLLTGLLGHTFYYILTAYTVILSSVNFMAIMLGTLPIMAIVFERFVNRMPISKGKLILTSISVIGMIILSGTDSIKGKLILTGIFINLANLSWLLYLHIRKIKGISDNICVLGIECFTSGLIMIPFVIAKGGLRPINIFQGIEIAYVSIIATGVGYYIYLIGNVHIDTIISSIYINLLPVITLIAYLIIYKKGMELNTLIGAGLILIATILTYSASAKSNFFS